MPKKSVITEPVVLPEIPAIKGFDKDLRCRDFQFEIGATYTHKGDVQACKSGFHAITGNPLEVFGYYPPARSRFADVVMAGETAREHGGSDSKIAAAQITITAELHLPELIQRAVKWVMAQTKADETVSDTGYRSAASNTGNYSAASNTGYRSAASNTGYRSAASNTGYQSAASNTGDYSAASNTGYRSAASNTGYQSAASNTGNQSAASNTGDYSAASNTGNQSAASNTGYQSAASNTGDYSAASNTGNQSAASNTGDYSAASNTGYRSAALATGFFAHATAGNETAVAIVTGEKGKARGVLGSWIVLTERDDNGKILGIQAACIDDETLKANTFYRLEDGKIIEIENGED